MNLGEKIFRLRKEKGLSQEDLAEKIGTTRQAISKWENNQGFPETEKLLLLSNVYEVSIDFLLKDEKTVKDSEERGYYVSKEMAKGFIANQKKLCRYVGIGAMSFVLSGIPYVMFTNNIIWCYLGMAICFVIGIIFFVIAMFSENQEYSILTKEPLLFDYEYMKELTTEFNSKKRKYLIVAIPCTILFVVCLLILVLTKREYLLWSEYHSIVFLGLAIGLLGFIYSIGVMETYELLVKNDEYSKRVFFKLRKKIREKISNM